MADSHLSAERARELFDYDPDTGTLTRRATAATNWRAYVVDKSHDPRGYIKTQVDNRPYFVHRIIWLIVYGTWPVNEIDHINRDPRDNRLINLRDVPREVNLLNRRARVRKPRRVKPPREGAKKQAPNGAGSVFLDGPSKPKPYRARISVAGKRINIGRFATAEEARAALDSYRGQ